jgi:hypothetical protein
VRWIALEGWRNDDTGWHRQMIGAEGTSTHVAGYPGPRHLWASDAWPVGR